MKRKKRRFQGFPGPNRLPLPNPFESDVWRRFALVDLSDDCTFNRWYENSIQENVRQFGDFHIQLLAMVAHSGRLPEFGSAGFDRFRREALDQEFSCNQLRNALEAILSVAMEKWAFPNAAHRWSFLSFAADFVHSYAEHHGMLDQIEDAVGRVGSLAMMSFIVAANEELPRR